MKVKTPQQSLLHKPYIIAPLTTTQQVLPLLYSPLLAYTHQLLLQPFGYGNDGLEVGEEGHKGDTNSLERYRDQLRKSSFVEYLVNSIAFFVMNKNQHITEYLDFYVNLQHPPGFAVLLRGDWGCGKSWLIKDFMKERGSDNYLYVSLYGITTVKDIEEAFFQQLHPVLASKGMKIAGQILKGVLKTTIKVDWDGDKKEDVSITSGIPDINLPTYLKGTDQRILVFDDLERCSIPIANVLGYINHFVEYSDMKAIIVANENEIVRKEKSTEDFAIKYNLIKEKLIGKSLDVKVDFEPAMAQFISELPNTISHLIVEKTNIVREVFDNSKYQNLRHLRQSMLDFERFTSIIPEKYLSNEPFVEHLLELFFSISFEIRKGAVLEREISTLLGLPLRIGKSETTDSPIDLIKKKHPIFQRIDYPISIELWTEFFTYGTMLETEVVESIENSSYFIGNNTPAWIKLWHQYDLEDEEFDRVLDQVVDSFIQMKNSDQYEVLHIAGLLQKLAKDGVINLSYIQIVYAAKGNIDRLLQSGKISLRRDEDFPGRASYGLGYMFSDTPEFATIVNYILAKAAEYKVVQQKIAAEQLLDSLSKSVDEFIESVSLSNSAKNLYYDIPVLEQIQPESFVNSLLALSNSEKKNFAWSFGRRYRFSEFNTKLISELPWLKRVLLIISEESEKRKKSNSGMLLTDILIPYIEKAIKSLEGKLPEDDT